MVLGRLRPEMSKAHYETWVEPLRPLSYRDGVVTMGAANPYGRDWVESRLKSSLSRLLEGVYNAPLDVQVVVANGFNAAAGEPLSAVELRARRRARTLTAKTRWRPRWNARRRSARRRSAKATTAR